MCWFYFVALSFCVHLEWLGRHSFKWFMYVIHAPPFVVPLYTNHLIGRRVQIELDLRAWHDKPWPDMCLPSHTCGSKADTCPILNQRSGIFAHQVLIDHRTLRPSLPFDSDKTMMMCCFLRSGTCPLTTSTGEFRPPPPIENIWQRRTWHFTCDSKMNKSIQRFRLFSPTTMKTTLIVHIDYGVPLLKGCMRSWLRTVSNHPKWIIIIPNWCVPNLMCTVHINRTIRGRLTYAGLYSGFRLNFGYLNFQMVWWKGRFNLAGTKRIVLATLELWTVSWEQPPIAPLSTKPMFQVGG